MSHLVAPSVLSANFANLQADIEMINQLSMLKKSQLTARV